MLCRERARTGKRFVVSRRTELVRLFEHDPDLLRYVPSDQVAAATDRIVVESVVLPRGELSPPVARVDAIDLGYLVLRGTMLRRVDVLGRRAIEIVGEGDVVRTATADTDAAAAVPCNASWRLLTEARVAILDRRFERDIARWPGITSDLAGRLARRSTGLMIQLAIARVPRVDIRLLLMFWRLAERWGWVSPDGVWLSLTLSRQTLGELVTAHRASVNVALRELRVSRTVAQSVARPLAAPRPAAEGVDAGTGRSASPGRVTPRARRLSGSSRRCAT